VIGTVIIVVLAGLFTAAALFVLLGSDPSFVPKGAKL
jgi:hypothetical protein